MAWGRSPGVSAQIHISGKLITVDVAPGLGAVAPSFPLPVTGEPDGTPREEGPPLPRLLETLGRTLRDSSAASPYNGSLR